MTAPAGLFASSIRPKLSGRRYQPSGGLFVVEGTVYPGAPNDPTFITDDGNGYWCGFASGAAGGVTNRADGLWHTEGIGYPALTTPMWASAMTGRANLSTRVNAFMQSFYLAFGFFPPIITISWSQGDIAAMLWWTLDVLPTTGKDNWMLPYVRRMYSYGQPIRCPGVSFGDQIAGLPGPGTQNGQITGGVGGPQDLTPAQANVLDPGGSGRPVIHGFNNHGDLYGAAPVGATPWAKMPAVGAVEYSFFKIIMDPTFGDVLEVGLDLLHPIADIEAGWNTMKFFAAGGNAPHFQYGPAMDWVVNDAVELGLSLPHSG